MKIIAYCRKSTEDKNSQVQSINDQKTWCEEEAQRRCITIEKYYTDEKTWTKPKVRDWFKDMIRSIKKSSIKVAIISWELSRLARNPIDWWDIQYLLMQDKIEIYTSTWIYNINSNLIVLWVMFWQSSQYSIDLARNVKRGMKWKAEKWWWFSHAPIWFVNNKATRDVELDTLRAPYIKEAFKLRIQWKPYEKIAEHLYEKWFRTVNWNKVRWKWIEEIIRRKFYCWVIEYHWNEYDWKHDSLVDAKTWDKANKVNRKVNPVKPKTYHYSFKWIIKCWECWASISAEKHKWYVYYRCLKNKWIKCSQPYIREHDLELQMIEELDRYQISDEFYGIAIQALKDKTAVQELERWTVVKNINNQINILNNKEKRLLDLKLDDKIDDWNFENKNREIKNEKRVLREELEKVDDNIDHAFDSARRTLELLKSPSLYWNCVNYEKKGRLQKIVWSNIILKDKKLLSYCENELFSILKSYFIPDGGGGGNRTHYQLVMSQLL